MSMASEDVKQIKTTLSQILQNQTAMMAQIVLMNKQTNIMPTSPMNSAMTQSFLEGLKSKFSGASKKLLCTPSAKPLTVGPPKRKAELPLDNLTNTTAIANKHHRSLSQKPEDVVDENDENDAAVKENKKKATKSVEVGGGEKIYQKLEPMKKSEKETINQHKEKRNKKRDFDMALAKFEEKYGSISPTADGGEVGGDGQNQRGPGKGKGRGRGRQSRNNNGSDPAGPSTSHSSSTTNKQGAEFTPENDN